MVVAIRFARYGQRNRPFYRIQVADSRRAPHKKFIEAIGTYDPFINRLNQKDVRLDVARAKYWLSCGAQPSKSVARLLYKFDLMPKKPRHIPVCGTKLDWKILRYGPPPDYEAALPAMATSELGEEVSEDEEANLAAELANSEIEGSP